MVIIVVLVRGFYILRYIRIIANVLRSRFLDFFVKDFDWVYLGWIEEY